MSEILTESFCERCGTRYTFESAKPAESVLGNVKVRAKGLRTYATARRLTLTEAMADARGEAMLSATAQQLDAFHRAFSFCLGCRQYTCQDCWNGGAGRCRTCSPLPGDEERAAAAIDAARAALERAALAHVEQEPVDTAAPAPLAPLAAAPWPAEVLAAEVLAAEVLAAEPLPAEPAPPAPAWPVASPGEVEAGPPVLRRPQRAIAGLPPGLSLEEAVAGYEALLAAQEAGMAPDEVALAAEPMAADEVALAAEPMAADEVALAAEPMAELVAAEPVPVWPVAAAPVEPVVAEPAPERAEPVVAEAVAAAPVEQVAEEPVVAAAPVEQVAEEPVVAEPIAAAPEPDAAVDQPVVVAAEPELVAAAEPEPEAAADEPAPVWPVADAPVAALPIEAAPPPIPSTPLPDPDAWSVVAPDGDEVPRWPAARPWPRLQRETRPAPLAEVTPRATDVASMWAASARQVLGAGPDSSLAEPAEASPIRAAATGTTHACGRCGLVLSATARFCRRCGLLQA